MPTSSQIHIRGGTGEYNTLDKSYVAYLFGDDDMRFGTDRNESIIKCGDFVAHASGVSVDIGWEPQFVIFKSTNVGGNWHMQDMMRGMSYMVQIVVNDFFQIQTMMKMELLLLELTQQVLMLNLVFMQTILVLHT